MTKEKVDLKYNTKQSATVNSSITGKVYDAEGVAKFEISGSWLDAIYLKNLVTGERETVWKEPPMVPDAHL